MSADRNDDRFVTELTQNQPQLLGYIMAAVGDLSDSHDILQKTSIALWKRMGDYDPDRPFLQWAIGFARMNILAHYRDSKREKLLFDSDLVEQQLEIAEETALGLPQRQQALRTCMQKLRPQDRDLLTLFYTQRLSVKEIADARNRSIDSVKSLMKRLRKALGTCIDKQLQSKKSQA